MNEYKVMITTLAISDGEYCHETYIEARSEDEVFEIVTSKDWFKYTERIKVGDSESVRHYFVQVKNIVDIFIKEEER